MKASGELADHMEVRRDWVHSESEGRDEDILEFNDVVVVKKRDWLLRWCTRVDGRRREKKSAL